MSTTILEISKTISAKLSGNGNSTAVIKHLLIDSRKIINAENSLFFSIKGERHNGHQFIAELFEKGIRNFVVSEPVNNENKFQDATFLT
ncbi:MAG TPA: Mur ligase domain-containing protein, partial [Bacteroidia bacterium]|nr:Mur ligase domain-containing protein [Bacteroidia bacterium]